MMTNHDFNIVRKIITGSLSLVVSVFGSNAMATGDSGVNCKAANLTQALNLGLGHDQNGANNNGTGNFFVVCPLDYEDHTEDKTLIEVGVRFPSGGGTVDCTARGQHFSDDSFTFQPISVTSAGTHGQSFDSLSPAWNFVSGAQTNATIVCALGPGESIKWYSFRP